MSRPRIHAVLGVISLAVLTGPLSGCSDSTSPSTPQPPTLAEHVEQLMLDAVGPKMPGVALRVIGDGVDLDLAVGQADVSNGTSLTPEHRFHVASVGKSFVGVAFAKLASEGRIDPDGLISTWLPADLLTGIPQSNAMTVRHLLNHTSGTVDVHNEIPDLIEIVEALPTVELSNADHAEFAKGYPLHFSPGTAHRYSNTNYILLAMILEEVTGKSHAQALRDLVFDPLGMTETSTSNHEPMIAEPCLGYMIAGDDYEVALDIAKRWEVGSGGQWSTADDVARFIRGIAETDLVLDDRGRDIALEGSAHSTYGFGLDRADTPHGSVVWHNGIAFGYSTVMIYNVDRGVAVALTANAVDNASTEASPSDQLLVDILAAIFERETSRL